MTTRLLNRKTAIAVLAATAVLGGGVAYAYPPGTPLSVSATAAPTNDPGFEGQTKVLVTVTAANPTCATRIQVSGASSQVLPPGTTTAVVYRPAGAGRYTVRARTVDCDRGDRERASSRFVVLDARAVGESSSIRVRRNFGVRLSGFEPGSEITVTATLAGSNPLVQIQDLDVANRRGEAKTRFKFRSAGTWTITTTSVPFGAVTAPFQVTVTP